MTTKKSYASIIIGDESAFEKWRKDLHLFGMLTKNRYELQLPQFSATLNKELTHDINASASECGCKTGGLTMSLACCGSIAYYFLSGGTMSSAGFAELGWLVANTALGAAVGKVAALFYARWRLVRLSDRIHAQMKFQSTTLNQKLYGTNL